MNENEILKQLEDTLSDGKHDTILHFCLNVTGFIIPLASAISALESKLQQDKINDLLKECLKYTDQRISVLEKSLVDIDLNRPIYCEFIFNHKTLEILSSNEVSSLTRNTNEFTINLINASCDYNITFASTNCIDITKSISGIHLKIKPDCPDIIIITFNLKPFCTTKILLEDKKESVNE